MIKIGIIGCGYWGPNLVRNFSNIDGCIVTALSDIKKKNMDLCSQKLTGVKKFADFRKMLKGKTVDAVVVATNLAAHYEVAREVLNAGKDMLIEKPLTADAVEAAELVRIAAQKKVILAVGHTFLFNKGIEEIKKYISSRKLGKLLYMHAVRTNLGPIRRDTNALWDLATHDVSIFLYLVGAMPLSVSATGGAFIKKGREDVVFVTLNFPGGVIGNVYASWLEPSKVRRLTIIGDKKMLIFDDIDNIEPLRIYDKSVVKDKKYDDFGEFQLILRDGDVTIPKIRLTEPLKNECQAFIESLKGNNKNISDGLFGLQVVRVLEAAQKSMKNGGVSMDVK